MDTATKFAQRGLLWAGGLALGLGLLDWAGVGGKQVGGFHVILGMVVVSSLWALCVIAARAGVSKAAVAGAASFGVVAASLGIVQEQLVPGDLHWMIRLTHLVISMAAIWWGRRLVSLLRWREAAALSGPAHEPLSASPTMERRLAAPSRALTDGARDRDL